MATYDMVLTGGEVVDPRNGVRGRLDLGIAAGKIEAAEVSLPTDGAREVIDVRGRTIVPGIIDTHVHVGGMGDGIDRAIGLKMVAQTGVTTALDLACQPQELVRSLQRTPIGLTVAGLCRLNPGTNLSGPDPSRAELQRVQDEALRDGAIGIKVLGGGVPLSPQGTADALDVANQAKVYAAFHLGTSATGSHLEGVRELPTLLGTNRVHVAHVNSYCRGFIKDAIEEALETFAILERLDGQVVAESYMAVGNGSGAHARGEEITGASPRNMLALRGYPGTRTGMHQALRDGYCSVVTARGGVNVFVSGDEGVDLWEAADTNIGISFPVNPPPVTFLCATRCRADGSFLIDALATDGGSFPRNVLIEKGLALVRYGALTLEEFVQKASVNPAWMLGLDGKGHLAPGADADITVLDLREGRAAMSFAAGELIMLDGIVLGRQNRLVVTEAGERAAQEAGLAYQVLDTARCGLYQKRAAQAVAV